MGDSFRNRGATRDTPLAASPSEDFLQALASHQGRLRGYILSLLADAPAADDVLQETNIVLCRKADRYQPGTSFRSWAFRIAHLQVMRERRNRRRDRLVFDDDLLERLEAEADRQTLRYETQRRTLLRCLRSLGSQQRHVILERYIEARAVQEIAADLGRTPNAISLVLHRARQNLMDCVARHEAGTERNDG